MKKVFFILIMSLLCSCSNKDIKETKISSTGELICIYKEQRINENTIYTSYYSYKFSDQGILKGASNNEEIILLEPNEEIKNKYEEALREVIKEYEGIKGITITKTIEEKEISFNIDMDISTISNNIKKDYYLDSDRISIYKEFTNKGYICE